MKKKIIILIVAIIIMLPVLRFLIYSINCNKFYRDVESSLKEETIYFNNSLKIKYDDLSNLLKEYITEDVFYNLHTWYDVYYKFTEIPNTDANINSINWYSFKYITSFIDNDIKKSVYYRVTFVDTLFGMKIDYITIEIPDLEIEDVK
ncbi:MAG: hypothetical protein PHC69_06270 [Ruminiclostridium sp.]|nr:hypothetical protein [Ruminiclostridium sp.]